MGTMAAVTTGSITRYRVMAYVTGIVLLLLVLVAMPLKYLADRPALVESVGPVHGFLYAAYLATAIDLAYRARWSLTRTVLVLLAGTIPFAVFVVERRIAADAAAQRSAATG